MAAGQLFADHRAHAAHDEAAVGEAQDDPDALDESLADDGRLVQARSFLLGLDPLGIGPAVVEAQGIERLQTGKPFLEGVGVQEVGDSLRAEERKWWLHSGQTPEVLFDLLAKQGRLASLAAHPDAFGHPLAFGVLVPGVLAFRPVCAASCIRS